MPFRPGQGANAYVTRLHVRYDAKTFPEDLVLLETKDRTNFQGRYILRHPWAKEASCPAGETYREALPTRFRQEAANLANLTGWPQKEIEAKMEANGQPMRAMEQRDGSGSAHLTRPHVGRRNMSPMPPAR